MTRYLALAIIVPAWNYFGAVPAVAQVQIVAVPKTQDVFKHIPIQAWTIRACNASTVAREMNEDEVYLAVAPIPFMPSADAMSILSQKQSQSVPAQIVKYLGAGVQIAAPIMAFKVVAASTPITGALVSALSVIPVIEQQFTANVPSIATLTENLLSGSATVPAGNGTDAGCVHWTAYSSRFPKGKAPMTVGNTVAPVWAPAPAGVTPTLAAVPLPTTPEAPPQLQKR